MSVFEDHFDQWEPEEEYLDCGYREYRGGVDDFANPDAPAEGDPRETLGDELEELAYGLDPRYAGPLGGGAEPWPPSEEWTRRLRAVLAEAEGAQRSARGDDPPDSGQSLGLETRGGAR